MRKREVQQNLDIGNAAMRLAHRHAFYLGELLEPADSHRADRLVTVIPNHMRRLKIVAIERMVVRQTGIIHEADRAQGEYLDKLFHALDNLNAKRVVPTLFNG